MTKLDAATAKRITRDWANAFPDFVVRRPLQLIRRLGPIIQGIALERSSSGDDYLPTAHVHALTREFPVLSLTLAERLRGEAGVSRRIRVAEHDEMVGWATERLRVQTHLSLDRPPLVGEILGRYREVINESQRAGIPAGVIELEDLVSVSTVLGRLDDAARGIDLALDVSSRWSTPPHGWSDVAAWVGRLTSEALDSDALRERVDRELEKHKLLALASAWTDN